jgi:hypothetical protein
MKTFSAYVKYFLLLSAIVFLFSCTKSATENKLLGTWKWINIANINDTASVEKWTFAVDGKLRIYLDLNGITDTVPNEILQYTVKSYKKLILAADSTGTSDNVREWTISKLKSDVMILNREEGGLVTKEFVKM